MEDKIRFLRKSFQDSLTVADFQWSLFVAALSSYKHDTVLRPFPPMFMGEQPNHVHTDNRDFKNLVKVAGEIPEFRVLLKDGLNQPGKLHTQVDLLYWCLNKSGYALQLCDTNIFADIKEKTKQQSPTTSPNYIFEVIHSAENDDKFQQRRQDNDLLYGYHGSNVENYHSILNFGLQSHMSKNALFGEGTYLSSELAISLQYSPYGSGWDHSILGDRLSCIAVCEMIDNPRWVKCQTQASKKDLPRRDSRSKIAGSEGGEIPETYYVVRNNEAIRVKYLLLYVDRTRKRSSSWLNKHKFSVYIWLYGLLLLLIALYNSKSFRTYAKKFSFR